MLFEMRGDCWMSPSRVDSRVRRFEISIEVTILANTQPDGVNLLKKASRFLDPNWFCLKSKGSKIAACSAVYFLTQGEVG